MRLDKFLKISRIIKRRTLAKEACDRGRININDREAKAGTAVNVGDKIEVKFSKGSLKACVKSISGYATKENSANMYEIISGEELGQ